MFIVFKGFGYVVDVFVIWDMGSYFVVEIIMSIMVIFNDLYKGWDSGEVWFWLIDVSVVVMILMFVLGFGFLLYIKKCCNLGLFVVVIGMIGLWFVWWLWVF